MRALTSPAGSVTDRYSYDAFGTELATSGNGTANAYRFTGEQQDAALGMDYLRARYYQPGSGRFWTRDTWGLDQQNPREWNRYAYVAADPVNGVDPSGYVGFEYGRIRTTYQNATKTAVVWGHRAGAAIGAAKAAFDALDARLISQMIRTQLAAEGLFGALKNLTIAQTTVLSDEGETVVVVAVNGASRSQPVVNVLNNVIALLRSQGKDAFIADGDMHAEIAAYQRALTYSKDIIGIGISNMNGPCGPEKANCAAALDQVGVTVYYLGRLLIDRKPWP